MKFWDASAIVALLVAETASERMRAVAARDGAMLVWWGSEIECASAIARREREGSLSARDATLALQRLRRFSADWHEVDASDVVRAAAVRFLRVHTLRAADALQLAAAFMASERNPRSLTIVTLDDRLAAAARKEGFAVIDGLGAD